MTKIKKVTRDLKEENIKKVVDDLECKDWSYTSDNNDLNDAYNMFSDEIKSILDRHCPVKTFKVKNNYRDKSWITSGIKRSIRSIREKQYYSDSLSKHKNNVKETWKILNEAIRKKGAQNETPYFIVDNEGNIIRDNLSITNGSN